MYILTEARRHGNSFVLKKSANSSPVAGSTALMGSNNTMWAADMQILEQRSSLGETVGMKDLIQYSTYVEWTRSKFRWSVMPTESPHGREKVVECFDFAAVARD